MTNYRNSGGFTLIEMLVVVAIIGILSTVLLNALGPARERSKDARIIQEVNQVRNLAETLYDGDYDALEELPAAVINNSNLKALADDIGRQGGQLTIIRADNGSAYSAYSRLNTLVGVEPNLQLNYYCIDSSGRTIFTTNPPTTSPECPS